MTNTIHAGICTQDDVMHRDLTVGQALYYRVRLRLPVDFSHADIQTYSCSSETVEPRRY
jgi:ABC-type multidrug transport system ATPase subunit